MFKITLEFLKENEACQEGIDWFLAQNQPEMSVQDLKKADCPKEYMIWVARYLYRSGLEWPDDRYNDDLLQALVVTGDAKYLSLAGKYWKKERININI